MSEIFKLNLADFIKGLALAVLTSVVVIINDTINAGSLNFDWNNILHTAAISSVAYLLKQLLTNANGELLKK